MTATTVHSNVLDALHALALLELEQEPFLEALRQGHLARINCTPNHPPLFPPLMAWGETVKALRDGLAVGGWARSDERNYPRTINRAGTIAIAVATGDSGTGLAGATPCTKSVKGPSTVEAVDRNRDQYVLPFEVFEELVGSGAATNQSEDGHKLTTYLFLIHHSADELRCELSQPVLMGSDKRVTGWRERILFPPIPLDRDLIGAGAPLPPNLPDIDVEVKRKA